MLHDDMTLARLMVYAQSIEESKLRRITRSLKRSVSNDQEQLGLRRGPKVKKNLRVFRLNWREEVVLKMSNLHVSLVARNIMVSVYWVSRVAMVVIRKDIM